MKRTFYLMVEGVEEEYAYEFFERFGVDIIKDKKNKKKLEEYEGMFLGHYTITLDSRNFGSNRQKLIKVPKKEEEEPEEEIIKVPEKKEFEGKFKTMEKCIVGVYLPDTLQEFLQLCERKSTLIEAGEGRDAVMGSIYVGERKEEKEYYLKGSLLHRMRGALVENIPLEKVLKY